MNHPWFVCVLAAFAEPCLAGGAGPAAEPEKIEPLAGWFGVFPELNGYQRTFLAPVLAPARPPVAYRQTAKYEWTGGALKVLEVTLARDPAFKQKYAAEALGKEDNPPQPVRVNKRTGWLWNLGKPAEGKLGGLAARLVVPLAEDKALVLEARGAGPWEALTGLAERLDLARAEAALARPPRTDFRRTREAFLVFPKGIPHSEVAAWVGFPDEDVGSGVLAYKLPDGSRVLLGFAASQKLISVKHERKDGTVEDLVK
jgi:hypothetical protein